KHIPYTLCLSVSSSSSSQFKCCNPEETHIQRSRRTSCFFLSPSQEHNAASLSSCAHCVSAGFVLIKEPMFATKLQLNSFTLILSDPFRSVSAAITSPPDSPAPSSAPRREIPPLNEKLDNFRPPARCQTCSAGSCVSVSITFLSVLHDYCIEVTPSILFVATRSG
ncbi:hypothetical protein JOQ06_007276, partial [Pogonophryne albipinna]